MQNKKPMINVAFVLWTLEHFSGSEKVVFDLAQNLDQKKYNIFVVSITDGPVREIYERLGARVLVFSKRKRTDFQFILDMRQALIKHKINVVNAHHYMPLFWSFFATRLTNAKLVYTEHSRWFLEALEWPNKIMNAIFLRNSDQIIAISSQIEDYYLNIIGISPSKVRFISNGVDPSVYDRPRDFELRRELGITDQEKIIGMVAGIKSPKSHDVLLLAFEKVLRKHNDVKLLLVGHDFTDGTIHRLVAEKGLEKQVHLLGQRSDVPQLLSIFDIFCLVSKYEGMPLSILEAMCTGVPVIGSDVLGINEIIADGVNGLLVPSEDDLALSRCITRLLDDHQLRLHLGDAGKSFVRSEYNLNDKIREYDKLFSSLSLSPDRIATGGISTHDH